MGCGVTRQREEAPSPIQFRMKTRELTITPGTFVKLSHMSKIKEYQEIKKIGAGSFSDVLLCEHIPTKTKRALKVVHKAGITMHQRDNVCMLKEIQILKMLDHPNIIKCFEIFEDERKYYIATEYCPGGDLFGEITKMQAFTEAEVANIIFQILSALSYCHDKRVIHRDLKPENILLVDTQNSLTIKVGDFGSSCVISPETRVIGCFGSSYYLAPEVFGYSYNEKCDLWSVGIIMYILMTGTPPYQGKDSNAIMKQVKESPFRLNTENSRGLSPEAIELLEMLLEINPNSRVAASDAIQHPWITNHRNYKGESTKVALKKLRALNNQSKLREAVHIYLASQIVTHEEIKEIQRNFQMIDKDGNGKITRSELLEEYLKVMEFKEASNVVDKVLGMLDQDNDGNIDYTEFLVSCGENLRKLSQNNLLIAFNLFDVDGNGFITVDEIRSVLGNGQIADDKVWEELLEEADKNKDGQIDLQEFIVFMNSIKY